MDAQTTKERRVYTGEEARQMLQIGRAGMKKLIGRNVFRSIAADRRIYIEKQSFDRWLDGSEGKEDEDGIHCKKA